MKYIATFPTSARPQSQPVHENRGGPGGATRRSHLYSTRLKQLTRASPTWPVSIRASPPTALTQLLVPAAPPALPECSSAPCMKGGPSHLSAIAHTIWDDRLSGLPALWVC